MVLGNRGKILMIKHRVGKRIYAAIFMWMLRSGKINQAK